MINDFSSHDETTKNNENIELIKKTPEFFFRKTLFQFQMEYPRVLRKKNKPLIFESPRNEEEQKWVKKLGPKF